MLAMDIALDVEVVDLWDAEKKVSGAGEVFGRLGDQSWDGAERVKAVRNINHALLLVKGFASAGLRFLDDRADVIYDVAMRHRDVRVGIKAYEDGAGSKRVA